jgi:hypothetical protein
MLIVNPNLRDQRVDRVPALVVTQRMKLSCSKCLAAGIVGISDRLSTGSENALFRTDGICMSGWRRLQN